MTGATGATGQKEEKKEKEKEEEKKEKENCCGRAGGRMDGHRRLYEVLADLKTTPRNSVKDI